MAPPSGTNMLVSDTISRFEPISFIDPIDLFLNSMMIHVIIINHRNSFVKQFSFNS